MKLKVTLAQIPISDDINENFHWVVKAISIAEESQADILLTPEGSLSGYTRNFNTHELDNALEEITFLAASHNVGLALGTCKYEEDGKCYNEIRFYSPQGNFIGFHSKILICCFDEDGTPHYNTRPLQIFKYKGIPIAGLICNDMWANPMDTRIPNPFLVKQAALMGAKIVFHAVNGGRRVPESYINTVFRNFHESNLLLNAIAQKLPIVTVDSSNPDSVDVVSPGGVIGPDGQWLFRLPARGVQIGTYSLQV